MIGLVAIAGVSIALIVTMLRFFSGPSLYDRALAAKLVLIELALICAGVAVFVGDTTIVDVALALVMVAIVTAVAVLKFFRARTFQPALVRAGEDS
jgi:multicomponent Na+:H+ antiporter subunit F